MKYFICFLTLVILLEGKLVPTPFYKSFQRIGRDTTLKYLKRGVFNDIYGIAMVKPRGTNSTVIIASDPNWCRLIYTNINETTQEARYLRKFGGYGTNPGQFIYPKGLCIDTTVYQGNLREHSIYVADSWNNRIVKLKYKVNTDTIVADGIFESGLSKPTDVACVSCPGVERL